MHQFALSCIIEEVKSTNDIEGVHSTHRELRDVLEEFSHTNRFSGIIEKYNMLLNQKTMSFITCEDVRNLYTKTLQSYVPVVVGVPEINPVFENVNPGGKLLHVHEAHVTGACRH